MMKLRLYPLWLWVILVLLMQLVVFEVKVSAASAESTSSSQGYSEEVMKGKGRAVSLKSLQKNVKDSMSKGACPDAALKLHGINKVFGYIVDGKSGDLIIFGKVENANPPLYLEDFIIALKNTWMKFAEVKGNTYYYSDPGCSIDPDPAVLNSLQQIAGQIMGGSSIREVQQSLPRWHGVCAAPQHVRVLGIPFDSRFAKVMVDADYYMKRLVDGSERVDIDGFSSLTDMTMDIVREDISKNRQIVVPLMALNRFWFYPGRNDYISDEGIVYIMRSDVKLLTEEEFLTKGGAVAGTGRSNVLAQQFADRFTDKYKIIAEKRAIYKELEGLYRFVALARLMKHKDALSVTDDNLYYLMNQYALKTVPTDRTLPGVSNVKEFTHRSDTYNGYITYNLWLPSCGGVSMDIDIKDSDIKKDNTNALLQLKENILKARPSADSVSWDFSN
jgi:hypothetical protein